MKGYRRSKKDGAHDEIVGAHLDTGAQVVELDACKSIHPGIPDILVLWPGGFQFQEIKALKGKLNSAQVKWHAAYRGPKGTLAVVRTKDEALACRGVRP
jgi:hypothetical protein